MAIAAILVSADHVGETSLTITGWSSSSVARGRPRSVYYASFLARAYSYEHDVRAIHIDMAMQAMYMDMGMRARGLPRFPLDCLVPATGGKLWRARGLPRFPLDCLGPTYYNKLTTYNFTLATPALLL